MSIFNIFGSNIELPESFKKSVKENIEDDWKQIGNDFKEIGNDIRQIIGDYEKR